MDTSLIKPIRLQSLSFNANDEFFNKECFEQSNISIGVGVPNQMDKIGFLLVNLRFNIQSLDNEFILNSECSWAYQINDRKSISEVDIYSSVQHISEYLSAVITKMYEYQDKIIIVHPPSFEDMLDELSEKRKSLFHGYN